MFRKPRRLLRLTAATALPYDWFGIGLARLAGAHIRQMHGVTLAHGGYLTMWLTHHPLGSMHAVTIGNVILARDDAALRSTLAHEFEHVRQFHRWGLLFPLAYSAASLWSFATGKGLYWGNTFEVTARRAEK